MDLKNRVQVSSDSAETSNARSDGNGRQEIRPCSSSDMIAVKHSSVEQKAFKLFCDITWHNASLSRSASMKRTRSKSFKLQMNADRTLDSASSISSSYSPQIVKFEIEEQVCRAHSNESSLVNTASVYLKKSDFTLGPKRKSIGRNDEKCFSAYFKTWRFGSIGEDQWPSRRESSSASRKLLSARRSQYGYGPTSISLIRRAKSVIRDQSATSNLLVKV